MNDWIAIAQLNDIPRQGARVVDLGATRLALFRTVTDSVYALDDRCPHRGGMLSQGIVHDGLVTCPMHGFRVDLSSGEAVLPDKGCVRTYATRVEAGTVFLNLLSA